MSTQTYSDLRKQLIATASNPAQVRKDTWNQLLQVSERLASGQSQGADTADLAKQVADLLAVLKLYEPYWVFPGTQLTDYLEDLLNRDNFHLLAEGVNTATRLLNSYGDRAGLLSLEAITDDAGAGFEGDKPHYFTLLVVDNLPNKALTELRQGLNAARSKNDDFVFEMLVVDNVEDAAIAMMFNGDINACIVREDIPLRSQNRLPMFGEIFDDLEAQEAAAESVPPRGLDFAQWAKALRPHLDFYLATFQSGHAISAGDDDTFNRTLYGLDDPIEIAVTVLSGIRQRYETPLFDAMQRYAAEPVGNFHALPIARGNAIYNSKWIQDMGEFYGRNIFMAETSSTTGGLDSLLSPKGPIKASMKQSARAWGSMHTFYATNGTSTSNKIVVQALTRPGDIVLIDRNCHKSHHYGLILGGANPLYLDAYPLQPYAIYGAVPLRTIKKALLNLKQAGELDRARMVLLTNCTFDGVNYNVERYMEEILAIKPDMVFLWDEAWFAFASAMPVIRDRTAMYTARRLEAKYASDEYRQTYAAYQEQMAALDADAETTWLDNRLMPDPDQVRVRAYSTQSTHKSLSSLRQGSMMHVYDQDYERLVAANLNEAFFTHTSTSPNYQILASLDLARRQLELEGYAMVSNAYQMALAFRQTVNTDPLLSKHFHTLEPYDLIPEEYRPSGFNSFTEQMTVDGLALMEKAYLEDEFVVDPTRVTLYLANAGFNGDQFKSDVLMDRYGIQINKTSINSVLFIFTIGVTWSSLSYLIDSLKHLARDLEKEQAQASDADRQLFENRVRTLSDDLPNLPDFSEFHPAFRPNPDTPNGDMRGAYFLDYGENVHEYIPLAQARQLIAEGRVLVSTKLVVPYPPGFPILVPGQVVSDAILEFMQKLDVKEVHGYRAALGLSVFTEEALQAYTQQV